MDKEQALNLVKQYKQVVCSILSSPKVFLYGSYSKGTATKDSDIDVAVIVPSLGNDWLKISGKLWYATLAVSTLIEPVLLEEGDNSPLYRDIMKTGVAV